MQVISRPISEPATVWVRDVDTVLVLNVDTDPALVAELQVVLRPF